MVLLRICNFCLLMVFGRLVIRVCVCVCSSVLCFFRINFCKLWFVFICRCIWLLLVGWNLCCSNFSVIVVFICCNSGRKQCCRKLVEGVRGLCVLLLILMQKCFVGVVSMVGSRVCKISVVLFVELMVKWKLLLCSVFGVKCSVLLLGLVFFMMVLYKVVVVVMVVRCWCIRLGLGCCVWIVLSLNGWLVIIVRFSVLCRIWLLLWWLFRVRGEDMFVFFFFLYVVFCFCV